MIYTFAAVNHLTRRSDKEMRPIHRQVRKEQNRKVTYAPINFRNYHLLLFLMHAACGREVLSGPPEMNHLTYKELWHSRIKPIT